MIEKQHLITVFSLAILVNGIGQTIPSIIGSTVVIKDFESKLNIYNKNYTDKNIQTNKSRKIIIVKNNYKEEDSKKLKNNYFLETHSLHLGEYCITYSDIFFTKDFFNTVIQGKAWEFYDKIFIFEDLDWKGLVKRFLDLDIQLSAGSTVMRHSLSITHLKLLRFITDIESEKESAELIIKNSFKLSKAIHKNHLLESFSKDKKIWLIREKIRSINPKIYVLYSKYIYLYNKYFPSLIDMIFNEIDKPDLINFTEHLKKMRSNEEYLVEFKDLNKNNFNLPVEKYDKKYNSYFNSIEELNKAIEYYKNNALLKQNKNN